MDLGSLGFVVDSEKLYQEKVEAEAKVTKRNSVENGSNIQSPWRKRKKKFWRTFLVSKLDSSEKVTPSWESLKSVKNIFFFGLICKHCKMQHFSKSVLSHGQFTTGTLSLTQLTVHTLALSHKTPRITYMHVP